MEAQGLRHLGHSDLGGRPEGLQVVGTGTRLFVSHIFSGGFTEVDVADPRAPRVLGSVAAPPGSLSLHLQVQDDLLLVANGPDMWAAATPFVPGRDAVAGAAGQSHAAGVRIFDVSRRGRPVETGFADLGGGGAHRVWFDGGRFAYASLFPAGFDAAVLVVLDVADPARPVEVDRWWIPGVGPGENDLVTWPSSYTVSLHHATVRDGLVYGAWRDGGLTVHAVGPAGSLSEVGRLRWAGAEGEGSAVHSTVRLPGLPLLAAAEEGIESDGEPQRRVVTLVDVSDPAAPRRVGALPAPPVVPRPGARYGPHNLYEYRPGAWSDGQVVFCAHQGAGLRVHRVTARAEAEEIGWFLPDPPTRLLDPRPDRALVPQTNDVFVSAEGLVAVIDANCGLDILELDPK